MSLTVAPTSPSQKKWYEDDVVVVDKDEERQTQFSRAGIGFDTISAKLQELYEIGVLKLFIESEILKSNTGTFEPGFKEMYSPYSMTIPQRVGKDLLFTSDVEFSESGFVTGSLENDKKKIFLNRSEFSKYLLRLPKPISDIGTPLDEKRDTNAYKYLQVLGDELQDKILFLCDNFINVYNEQYTQNTNDISRLQKEIGDLKRLTTGSTVTAEDIQKRLAEKDKALVQAKNIKIQLETKRTNYKNACAILSNATRRSQYNASLVAAFPALKIEASSYSTALIDWFKFKHNGSNFFKQVCRMFKLVTPKEMLTARQNILIAIQEVATKLGEIFKPVFESYFFNELNNVFITNANYALIIPNVEYRTYLNDLNTPANRQADARKYSWLNIDAMLSEIITGTRFTNEFYKTELERLQSIVKLMVNYNSEILTLFSLRKFEKNLNMFTIKTDDKNNNNNNNNNNNIFEIAEQDDDFFKRAENVNLLFQNVYYLRETLVMISNSILVPPSSSVPGIQAITKFIDNINEMIRLIMNTLFPQISEYQEKVQKYDYDTLLGTRSHSKFVENVFTGKVAFISYFHKNNKFLVSSEFIRNNTVIVTIPDGNYTLKTLSSVIEGALCSSCKWSNKSNYDQEMIWRCAYDNKNFLQLKLYFPFNNINRNPAHPNIPNFLNTSYEFEIYSNTNTLQRPAVPVTRSIPTGEYKNINQILDVMQKTITDIIHKPNASFTPLKSVFTIALENYSRIGQRIIFKLKKKQVSSNRFGIGTPHEDLIITLDNNLSLLFSRLNTNLHIQLDNDIDDLSRIDQGILNQGIQNANSEKRLMFEPHYDLLLSETITITTRTNIDGEVYDTSEIFGVTQPGNNSIQLFPDIITNALQISDRSYDPDKIRNCNRLDRFNFQPCIFLSDILTSTFVGMGLANNSFMDFGILNFTSKRINNDLQFNPVNMSEVEKKANALIPDKIIVANQTFFKREILEKTSIYVKSRLINSKVPVITPTDILNSILYRYPCIPSAKSNLIEGSTEFDEFIQERVNVLIFNDIVCLGKSEREQVPSITFKNILEKTMMYDSTDGRRNKLFCDLHYAICGPVYTDTNPSREINQLTMFEQFTLQNNRPNVIEVGKVPTESLKHPFTVKGITSFYDFDKEYYKYLIYGEYLVETDTGSYTTGCIKYYDPGEKIGPGDNVNASELYDVILTESYDYDESTGMYNLDSNNNQVPISSTIINVVWIPTNDSHEYSRFLIIGDFQVITYLQKNENEIEKHIYPNGSIQNYTLWVLSHKYPTQTSPPEPSYFDTSPEINSIVGFVGLAVNKISNILPVVSKYNINLFSFVIVTKNKLDETSELFLPYENSPGVYNPNKILVDTDASDVVVPFKVSCTGISVNNLVNNIHNRYRFYNIMNNKHHGTSIGNYLTHQLPIINDEYGNLDITLGINPGNMLIQSNLLWVGLKEKTTVRKILSCTIIDITGSQTGGQDIPLPIQFEDDDTIENIRVDVNNPEVVTVFGKFKATINDIEGKKPNKVIQNIMVIYTNLQNVNQNDSTFATLNYSFEYDNFKEISVHDNLEFKSFYSCTDGLIPASIDKGTNQQNVGIFNVKRTQTSEPVIVGFHNTSITAISEKSNVKRDAISSRIFCYDYNMYANRLKINRGSPLTTKIENGVFNPLMFYTFYFQNENFNGSIKPVTTLSKGVYALIHSKNPNQLFSTPSNLHILNTWGIDLSTSQTLFYKRLYEATKTSGILKFNLKGYETYMNDIIDTILSSVKTYYEDKIKPTFYEYGAIDGTPPILFKRDTTKNILVGGGKKEDAQNILLSTEYAVQDEMSKNEKRNRMNTRQKKIVEIRIPDIMMSDEYLNAILEQDRKNVRIIFVNSIFKHAMQLYNMIMQQNEDVIKNRGSTNNVVIVDDYQFVICSKNETIRSRFNELKAFNQSSGKSFDFLTLSDDVFNYEFTVTTTSKQNEEVDKNVIIVNEWNEKGFIGDYGAYAYSDTKSLTTNQQIISESQQAITEATPLKQAVTRIVPKYSNTAFLLNPIFSYHTLDPSKWVGVKSLFEKSQLGGGVQTGGVGPLYAASSYGSPMQYPFFSQGSSPYGAPYGYGYGYNRQPKIFDVGSAPQGYGYGNGYGYDENEIIRMKRKVLEASDVPSKKLKKISFQTMQTDTRFKKIVLWLFDARENKMLMTKTLIGNNKVVLSLPTQNQQVSTIRASGYSLLQQLCRRLFNQADVIRKWTLEVSYAYQDDENAGSAGMSGIFIYSAKSYDLPKPTLELIYVNMQAVLNLTKGAIIIKKGSQLINEYDGERGNGNQVEINQRDTALIDEVFRVVPLIQGGIISSTSKEFNEIVASLVTKTPHQHLRSYISENKRRENVEKNINFLINLFFPQNSLFFVRGQVKYFIYSVQRSCKIFTIVKQPSYDDDSYLTCLKIFLQSEYDYKQKLNTFRVGCSLKKKLIVDNFSSVWDSFWTDLIESQEQAANVKQIENEIGETDTGDKKGELSESEEEKRKKISMDERITAPVCLNDALTTCKKMYPIRDDWNLSSYYPLAYYGVLYNIDPTEQPYGFNNDYYYTIDNLDTYGEYDDKTFYGFKCMKYNGDSTNPILYLGGKSNDADGNTLSSLFKLNLKTKKITPILLANTQGDEILCIDMIGNKHLLIGGKFKSVIQYKEDGKLDTNVYTTPVPLIIVNTDTYVITVLSSTVEPSIYNETENTKINKVCVCKKIKNINTNENAYHEYVGLFGGDIQISTNGPSVNPDIDNVGYLVIKVPIDESKPNDLIARMYCIDSYIQNSTVADITFGLKLRTSSPDQLVNITSIICDEDEGKYDGEEQEKQKQYRIRRQKNKTTFYVGGYFNTFSYIDYKGLKEASPANVDDFVKVGGQCNSIIKLTITTSYKSDYEQECIFEPIETNANKNNIIFNVALALYRVNLNKYLIAFTGFFDGATTGISINDTLVVTNFNVLNVTTKGNTQIVVATPQSYLQNYNSANMIKRNYGYTCLTIVQDLQSKKYVALMSYTLLGEDDDTDIRYAYSFTCELNMEVPLRVIESKRNDELATSHYNSITDMCAIENQNKNQIDVYVAHENIAVQKTSGSQILYTMTVKSNYQQIGNWNMATIGTSDEPSSILKEVETFFRFVKSVMELSKIFKEYPSMMLFLQNIDYRDKNEKITKNRLEQIYIDLQLKTSIVDTEINPKIIEINYPCNDIFFKLNQMLYFWFVMNRLDAKFNLGVVNTDEINITLFSYIKNFYDDFIFLLIYAGCISLAELLCNNYADSILNGTNLKTDVIKLDNDNIKSIFINGFQQIGFGDVNINNKFKIFFDENSQLYDPTFTNIMICSNPETYTGVAYVARRLDKNLTMLVDSEAKQKALQHKIYKSNQTFFNTNDNFFTTLMASDSINTVDQINFCSFYKFQQFQDDKITPFKFNFGNMMNTTIYACVNVDSNLKIQTNQVLDFLKVIIAYFKGLPSGAPIIETGIGGRIQRILFGGNFGCNLLHDAEICEQFTKNGMKIYTMPNNTNAFIDNTNDSGNHIFVVDANVMASSLIPLSVGGGESNMNRENKKIVKRRLIIGETIQNTYSNNNENTKFIIVNHKKKTKRRYK
jgi:hypothetical protein